jgi:hypothetical protein
MLGAAPLSPTLLLVPVAILLASGTVYYLLVRRWTTQRRWLALADWAEANKFKLHGEQLAVLPEVLKLLTTPPPRALLSLNDADTALLQIETSLTPSSGPAQSTPAEPRPSRWNLLVRKLELAWPMTGLRPQGHAHSILDFFPLADMQAMSPSERFVLYGAESRSARALSKSILRGLLPPDIGLLVVGHNLILDFSARPFDELTLERIDALAEQLVLHLPAPQ